MTDEELEERIRGAYADVEMDPEAEERILANLLAAEQRAGDAARPAPSKRRADRRWRWVAPASIAAVLLVGVIVGTQIIPSYRSADDAGKDGGIVLMASGESEEAAAERSVDAAAVPADEAAEIVVLEDGSRFAIVDLYVPDEVDPGELDWQPATLEATGDACEVGMLEDGTCVVLFEGEGDLFLAEPLG